MNIQRMPYLDGKNTWKKVLSDYLDEQVRGACEMPENPYGDCYNNPPAKLFRAGFKDAAKQDGYTYSNITGEYELNGEYQTDDFPEAGELREFA